jgi:hypothetical protein
MTIKALEAIDVKVPKLKNLTYFNPGALPLYLSDDRRRFYGSSNNVLKYSTNVDTASTPTWTDIHTFPATIESLSVSVTCFQELDNGEAFVACTYIGSTSRSRCYVTEGWNFGANLSAPWLETLTTIGGDVYRNYSGHGFNKGKNGVVLVAEGGGQTAGGEANQAADYFKARRVFINRNFAKSSTPGADWPVLFDLYTYGQSQGVAYPANVHVHGVAYDEDWDRVWICYGDNSGDGKNIAGLGNTQVVYIDDASTDTPKAPVKLPQPVLWSVNTSGFLGANMQFIQPVVTEQFVKFTPDVSNPLGVLIYPKIGYRKLGDPINGPDYGSGVAFPVRRGNKDKLMPLFFGGQVTGTQTGTLWVPLAITADGGLTWYRQLEEVPLQSPALASRGYIDVFGPTINGKVVLRAQHHKNNDSSKKYIQADFVIE